MKITYKFAKVDGAKNAVNDDGLGLASICQNQPARIRVTWDGGAAETHSQSDERWRCKESVLLDLDTEEPTKSQTKVEIS